MKLILPHPSNAYYKFSYATKPRTQATQNAQGNTQATNLVASAPAHHPLTLLVPTNPCRLRLPANLCRLQLDQSAPTPARSVCASPDLNPLHLRLRPKTRTSKIKSAIKEAPTKDCATRQWKHRPTTAKPSPKPFSEKLYRALSRILEGHVGTRCPGHLGYVDFLERLGVGNPCWRLTWRRQSGTMSAELTQC
ncbi:hypothetical protein BHM03_00018019 [Ensete ventricosum]|nr:hypothetical protein BHM03_00018019 [Ensete ventricosum]